MERKSCFGEFARYASFNVMGMLGLSCYILADTFFVSKALGANGLTALNLAIPIYSFVHGSGLMFGVGGATKFAVLRGQGAKKEANQSFTSTVYMTVILGAIYLLLGVFLSEKITLLLGANANVFAMTSTYLKVILLFAPAFMMNDVLLCFVRNDGNPRLSMCAMLVGSLSNIVLDYIFLFPLHLGIFGAVLATGIAPIISMLMLSVHFKRKEHVHLVLDKGSAKLSGKIIALGVPSLITEIASGIVMIVFNSIILSLQGNVGVAAYGVIANLSLVVLSVYTGIAQGMQPLISKAHGYRDHMRIRQILRYAMVTMLSLSIVIYLSITMFTDGIVGAFNSENNRQLQEIAVYGLQVYFVAIPFAGFNVVLSMFFTSIEKPIPSQVISILRGMLLMIPMAYLLAHLAGLQGVWLTLAVTEGIVALLGLIMYYNYHQKR